MTRFAARLLFQYRVEHRGRSNKMRTCEERTLILRSRSPAAALKKAERYGRKQENSVKDCAKFVYFEFVGVTEMLALDSLTDEDEVWWDIRKIRTPSERKRELVPVAAKLRAFSE